MVVVPDDEELLEFNHGAPKHFPFFHRDPGSGVGCIQCCQKIFTRVEVVLNFFAEVERQEVHGATAFLTRVGTPACQETVRQWCNRLDPLSLVCERSGDSAGHDCLSEAGSQRSNSKSPEEFVSSPKEDSPHNRHLLCSVGAGGRCDKAGRFPGRLHLSGRAHIQLLAH